MKINLNKIYKKTSKFLFQHYYLFVRSKDSTRIYDHIDHNNIQKEKNLIYL